MAPKISSAFKQTGDRLDEGMEGEATMDYLVRALSQSLDLASPAAVVFDLQNLVVQAGTPFTDYMETLFFVFGSERAASVGHATSQNNTLGC